MIDYDESIDRTASDIRDELRNRIQEVVNTNQECFIANWLLQNPDADLSKIRLCHGFQGTHYTFWVEDREIIYDDEGNRTWWSE